MAFIPKFAKSRQFFVGPVMAMSREYSNGKALVRSIFARPCAHARAQNVLSAAQFCAHFKIPKSFQSS